MNAHFCSIGKSLASKIENASNLLLAGDSVVNNKSPRFKFKHYFLKLALPFMETSLAIMLNTSIETSLFPKFWKLARATPVCKGGDRSDKSKYYPISILPVISRLFEKLIADQLYQYMNENNMFPSN